MYMGKMKSECFLAGTGAVHKLHMIFLKAKLIYIPNIFLHSECLVKLPPGHEKESKWATSFFFSFWSKSQKEKVLKLEERLCLHIPLSYNKNNLILCNGGNLYGVMPSLMVICICNMHVYIMSSLIRIHPEI